MSHRKEKAELGRKQKAKMRKDCPKPSPKQSSVNRHDNQRTKAKSIGQL